MVCKSLQVEELQIRVDTWKQEVLIWNNYGKIGIKSFLANETKVKKKNSKPITRKQNQNKTQQQNIYNPNKKSITWTMKWKIPHH